ncbi:MAG: DEAD/DEAH box helicase family protein, partial [Clostridiales bacterium]|nr:DEAD/DEAH box helicase family protein [Clostridiales bacterium]
PMLPDETCRFLAFDFDGKDCAPDELQRDVSAIREVSAEKHISMAAERSRSGKGIHLWIFFSENIPASAARKFGSSLITYAMNRHHELSFKTYDRMIPNQDTMPKGGFGNLIALPLQKLPREQGNSVFIDENYDIFHDQWSYLNNIKKYSLDEVEKFIRELSPTGELGALRRDEEDEKPWEGKKSAAEITRNDFPETVSIVCSNMLYVKKKGVSNPALNALKRLAAFRNPEFYKAQAMRLSTYDTPRIISCADETEQYLCLPRGLKEEVGELMDHHDVKIDWISEVNEGRKIDVSFKGTLYDEQQQAFVALRAHDNGILSPTTAFAKTVIGASMIAEHKVNTLILVHRRNLLSQWVSRLNEFLKLNEEPVAEFTPTGRKKKKSVIGQIGGGKNNLSGVVDIAVMQSLVSAGEVRGLVKNYGMVIVDECHHVSAFSFERILKAVNAKYVYGLTATPKRQDGHHPIIMMQCGPIRYRVDAKDQADARPFEHYIIPRITRFRKPANQDEAKWMITDIYRDIQNSEIRNGLIIRDVIDAAEHGRNPIILTERTEHVKLLPDALRPHIRHVVPMTGGTGQKKSRELFQAIAEVPADEPLVLVATGKYVGEGFDMPRLDTLFLAMPISWAGTVQQYAGRLHRLFDGKDEVQIYDYVDVHVAVLEKMYQKRLRSYAAIGYKAKGTAQPVENTHSIFDSNSFFPVYSSDILAAQNEVLIVSPFLTKRRILSAINYLSAAGARVTVITKPPDNYAEKDRAKIEGCLELLARHGISVKTRDRIHQKFAVVDQRIVWYGSINLLSYGTSEESMMRIENMDIAAELMGTM